MKKSPAELIKSAKSCGYDISLARKLKTPHLFVELNKVLSLGDYSGLTISVKEVKPGLKVRLLIKKNKKIDKPIFFCFGVLRTKGRQLIFPEIILEEGAEAKIFANCIFPKARNVTHKMEAKIKIGEKAKLRYLEGHYHGENSGASVIPRFKVFVGKGGVFENEFILNKGSVGKLEIELESKVEEKGFMNIMTKIIGRGEKDKIRVSDNVYLHGKYSRSMVKLRGVVINGAEMLFQGRIKASEEAKFAKGHVDCQEIVVGEKSFAQSIPVIETKTPEARITHEASVGKINQKELEVLMSRGLTEREAIDFIIRGALK